MKRTSCRTLLTLVALLAMIIVPLTASGAGKARAVAPTAPTGPITPTSKNFAVSQIEAYLSDDGIAYVRPGLKIKVNSITIGSDRKPVVDLTLTDNFDNPIDRSGKVTPGAISLSFILAYYDPATRHYRSYITRTATAAPPSKQIGTKATQAAIDSGGKFTDLETGHAKYAFGNALPADFDQTKTHTLGIYSTRNLTDIIGKNYFANVEYDFRPDGQAVTAKWDKINQATSCNNCHNPLSAHGGARQDVRLCVLCHTDQTSDPDTGNTVDMKVMAHKIHRGENLPSVKAGTPYQIIGFGQSVVDFSTVALPQDINNCANCHEGTDATKKPSQSDAWLTHPSRAACGSCHDDVNFATGANHKGGIQLDDATCARCHVPDSGQEYDASMKGAHVVDYKSKQLKGLTFSVVSATNVAPGKKPTAVFSIRNGDGTPVDGTKLTTFAPILAGATTSYSTFWRESGLAVATNTNPGTFDATTGTTTYTFTHALPADASGTWSISADVYRNATLKHANGAADTTVREAAFNDVKYFAVTDKTPVARRSSVLLSGCNSCHDRLALHGGQRQNTQECVICHNPTNSDTAQRPASAGAPESISLQRLIHRIHTGEELTQDFTIYGFGGSKNNFNEVRFPGNRMDCAKCHVANAYTLPLKTGIASVTTLRDYYTPQGPATAACLGCHDNKDAAAHAYLNTTTFGNSANTPAEACATCHGTGKDFAVDKVHAD
jgi:OmcA/MtrC family decaheme c-type cytochrome